MYRSSAKDCANYPDVDNGIRIDVVRIVLEDHDISQLPRFEATLDVFLERCESTVQMRIASVTEMRWLGPQTRPCMSLRVTMLWMAIIGSNGPGV